QEGGAVVGRQFGQGRAFEGGAQGVVVGVVFRRQPQVRLQQHRCLGPAPAGHEPQRVRQGFEEGGAVVGLQSGQGGARQGGAQAAVVGVVLGAQPQVRLQQHRRLCRPTARCERQRVRQGSQEVGAVVGL